MNQFMGNPPDVEILRFTGRWSLHTTALDLDFSFVLWCHDWRRSIIGSMSLCQLLKPLRFVTWNQATVVRDPPINPGILPRITQLWKDSLKEQKSKHRVHTRVCLQDYLHTHTRTNKEETCVKEQSPIVEIISTGYIPQHQIELCGCLHKKTNTPQITYNFRYILKVFWAFSRNILCRNFLICRHGLISCINNTWQSNSDNINNGFSWRESRWENAFDVAQIK